MAKDFTVVLRDPQSEDFILAGPIRVTHPDFVVTVTRYFNILTERSPCFVSAGGGRVPFAFASLRPLGGNARTIHAPARSFCFCRVLPGRIKDRFVIRLGCEAAHILRLIPEVLELPPVLLR